MSILLKCYCALALLGSCLGQIDNGRLSLKIYGTAGCTDTVAFNQNHLLAVVEEFSELDVTFIPWGRTNRHEDDSLTCQFFEADCWANRVQRCALNMLLPNQTAQLSYLSCEYRANNDRPAFLQGSYSCAVASGLNIVDLDYCVAWSGDYLDRAAEQASQVPIGTINFVPSIVFSDNVHEETHWDAFNGLRGVVCKMQLQNPNSAVTSC